MFHDGTNDTVQSHFFGLFTSPPIICTVLLAAASYTNEFTCGYAWEAMRLALALARLASAAVTAATVAAAACLVNGDLEVHCRVIEEWFEKFEKRDCTMALMTRYSPIFFVFSHPRR